MATLNDWLTQQPMDEHELALFAYEEDYDEPPDVDDSVNFCPECETPNQFGELCTRCRREIEAEGADYYPDGD
jgi:hypothetical protein